MLYVYHLNMIKHAATTRKLGAFGDELGMHQPSWDIEASVWPKKLRNLCLKSDAADDVKSLVEPRLHGVFVQETK